MTEGVIAAWHKNVGDNVKKGEVLADIETDKATMELECYKEGVLLHRGAENGQKLMVNDLMAIIGEQGEDISSLISEHTGSNGVEKPVEKEAAEPAKETARPAEKQESADAKKESKPTPNMDDVVLMPRLSDTMTEGVIAAWHKNIGDDVKKGDVLAEIETDKATMELESYKNGKLLYQGADVGAKIQVNELLCIIGSEGTDVDSLVKAVKGGGAAQPVQTKEDKPTKQATATENDTVSTETQPLNEGRIFASPLAKKMAEEKGIDLKYVKGSGDNGRITKTDVESYKPGRESKPQEKPEATQQAEKPQTDKSVKSVGASSFDHESFEEVPVSQMRKTIARRLAESKFSAPHFYLTMTIDMEAAIQARTRLNELSKVKISFNDLVLKAVAVSLKQHPKVNSSWLGDKIRINNHVNIGVAVAVEEGLLVPVIRNADLKPLSHIAVEVKDFAQKAKEKKLQPSDWEGNTFTISNLGMFGIDEFTAIINPPDACILAIGGISQVPVVKDGQVVPGNLMKVTLSCDHRVVDGATGAAFLQTLKSILEEPLRMLV